MTPSTTASETKPILTYRERLEHLRRAKLAVTREKQQLKGTMDHDDHGLLLPPQEFRTIIDTMSTSGMPIKDVLMNNFKAKPNHPSGGSFGPRACGENFRAMLDCHPVYLDPVSSLAGGYMVNFASYREKGWSPDLPPAPYRERIKRFNMVCGIGGMQHFCQDLRMGLDLGWGGLLAKIQQYRQVNNAPDFYAGLEAIVLGTQDWMRRHAVAAREQAAQNPAMGRNLQEIAEINEKLLTAPPATFREACQWILWYQLIARMYNGSGSMGKLDLLLHPYYAADMAAGRLTDEEAVFHIACLLIRDNAYMQLGGPDERGVDETNPVSFLILEAAHQLRTPANIGVSVGKDVDPRLFRRGVEILLQDRVGIPKFLGVDQTIAGIMKSGIPRIDALRRAYSGCHWSAIPGREYAIMDCIKIEFGTLLNLALRDMLADTSVAPSVAELWSRFERNLRDAMEAEAAAIDYHFEHMHKVFPELVIDLLCHGTIERGLDASHGGVDYYTFGIDGAALGTVADSFAAMEQRIERERQMTWPQLLAHLDADWQGADGERARLMMRGVPRFGSGGSAADAWAERVAATFTQIVTEKPTPRGFRMVPGLFSWANTIPMGKLLGATPNGRHAKAPISHGANPDPGFRKGGAPTALAAAVAHVQPGYGNAAPLQIDLDPSLKGSAEDVDLIMSLIRSHFDLGGTQININILDREQLLKAHKDPSLYPDLIVRVTGFSAYFASLSPDFRQMVVDRLIQE